ncbi:winged helix-turn-helix transcriptional regulator, partial [Akkermansiaceae bacterium]|nr:winged helix-turn-helix transcriptional regulator [Akkermansiaceae bacterium]
MRASYANILASLKRSDGMPISDLSRELGKSYMGIKQHCLKLTEMGYLEEWRVPREKKEVGRPEKLYRLTKKCDPLFPQAGSELSLSVLE